MKMYHISIIDKEKGNMYFNEENICAESQREAVLIAMAKSTFPPFHKIIIECQQVAAL